MPFGCSFSPQPSFRARTFVAVLHGWRRAIDPMLTGVSDTVAVGILLICVGDSRTVIVPIWNAVAVGIYELASLYHLIKSHFSLVGRNLGGVSW
jgi:hypothetical protein